MSNIVHHIKNNNLTEVKNISTNRMYIHLGRRLVEEKKRIASTINELSKESLENKHKKLGINLKKALSTFYNKVKADGAKSKEQDKRAKKGIGIKESTVFPFNHDNWTATDTERKKLKGKEDKQGDLKYDLWKREFRQYLNLHTDEREWNENFVRKLYDVNADPEEAFRMWCNLKEENIEELSKNTLLGYIKKSSDEDKKGKRIKGFKLAAKKVFDKDYPKNVNEDTEIEFEEGFNLQEKSRARVRIVKARVRKGKVQRRIKVSNVKGYTMRKRGKGPKKLVRMSPIERRKRKMGARRAKIKRRSKLSRMRMNRKRSMRKRKQMGLR